MKKVALKKMNEISYDRDHISSAVEEAFKMMEYDAENIGCPNWNPLGDLIRQGDKVLIKPNMVMHCNGNQQGGLECLYTQPAVVESVMKYVVRALSSAGGGTGSDSRCTYARMRF